MSQSLQVKLNALCAIHVHVQQFRTQRGIQHAMQVLKTISSSSPNPVEIPPTGLAPNELVLLALVDGGSLAFTVGGMQAIADHWFNFASRLESPDNEYTLLCATLLRISAELEEQAPDKDVMQVYQKLSGDMLLSALNMSDLSLDFIDQLLNAYQLTYPDETYPKALEHLDILVTALLK